MSLCENRHDWHIERVNCWVCRTCGATRTVNSKGIIHMPTDGNVSKKALHQIEQEIAALKKNGRN